MVNKDCFAYKNQDCDALRKLYCKANGKCLFYKTKEQNLSDIEKVEKIKRMRAYLGSENNGKI